MTQGAICNLKYFAGRANELHLLRDRVAELEDMLGIGESIVNTLGMLGLTPSEAAVLGALYKKRGGACARVIICMTCFTAARWIINVWGQGFRITDADKAKLKALIEARHNG